MGDGNGNWTLDVGGLRWPPAVQEEVLWSAGQRSSLEHFHSHDSAKSPGEVNAVTKEKRSRDQASPQAL